MADGKLKAGERLAAEELYARVRGAIHAVSPGLPLRPALFGCSDEVTSPTDAARTAAFARDGGIFTTRMIGSQVFYHQIKVAVSPGHACNVFEVNVHIGELAVAGTAAYGSLTGHDGMKRACCGTLVTVLDDFINNPDEKPSVSTEVDGELTLDFLGTLKWRLQAVKPALFTAPNPLLEVTRRNLEVQVAELVRRLEQFAAETPSLAPLFVFGTVTYNRQGQPDELALEQFLVRPPAPKGMPLPFEPLLK